MLSSQLGFLIYVNLKYDTFLYCHAPFLFISFDRTTVFLSMNKENVFICI